MGCRCAFFESTLGKKVIVAVTGLIMLGFVAGHLLGNLQVFAGPEKINDYAAFLHQAKPLLWGTRVALLVALVLHFMCTIQLVRRNRASRPIAYLQSANIQATAASRFMVWTGLFLLFYILYHLAHLTLGVTHKPFLEGDVYANIVTGFLSWPVSAIYVVGMVCLGFHLYHGVWSVFPTLGITHPRYETARRGFAVGIAVALSAGYLSIPAAVWFGVLHL